MSANTGCKTLYLEIDNFKGPLHLLLELIEKRKLPINEISLSKVADEFMQSAERMQVSSMEYAEFVAISSVLIWLKSKSLLPLSKREDEEDEASEDLQRRLKALKKLKKEAQILKSSYAKSAFFLPTNLDKLFSLKVVYKKPDKFISEHEDVLTQLMSLMRKEKAFNLKVKRSRQRTLSEFVKDIRKRLDDYIKVKFSELNFSDKEEKLLAFLAILELRRKGELQITQDESGDLHVEKDTITIPSYG